MITTRLWQREFSFHGEEGICFLRGSLTLGFVATKGRVSRANHTTGIPISESEYTYPLTAFVLGNAAGADRRG